MIEPAVVESMIADQHRGLLEAIVRSDPVAAERAMREHLVYLRDLVSAVEQARAERSTDRAETTVPDPEQPPA
ncbi:MAG: FCD domain-containing protein [Solirubrobacterales bacterium]|nr:FCD domain-containing protein [Solirubrobacterales bacterium]